MGQQYLPSDQAGYRRETNQISTEIHISVESMYQRKNKSCSVNCLYSRELYAVAFLLINSKSGSRMLFGSLLINSASLRVSSG